MNKNNSSKLYSNLYRKLCFKTARDILMHIYKYISDFTARFGTVNISCGQGGQNDQRGLGGFTTGSPATKICPVLYFTDVLIWSHPKFWDG